LSRIDPWCRHAAQSPRLATVLQNSVGFSSIAAFRAAFFSIQASLQIRKKILTELVA
jgi:hypothetical protein